MDKKKRKQRICISGIFLVMGLILDWAEGHLGTANVFPIPEYGAGEVTEELILNAENMVEDYSYDLVIQEKELTQEEVRERIAEVKALIDEDFSKDGQDWNHITENVNPQENYGNQGVNAEWMFDRYDVVHPDGEIDFREVSEDGTLVNAQVELSCGEYKECYAFSFVVYPRERSEQEVFLDKVADRLIQAQQSGEQELQLPEEVDGIPLSWKRKPGFATWKILIFEIMIGILLYLRQKEKAAQDKKSREQQLGFDYPEIVGKLVVLLESGMSIKQAWNRISAKYVTNRQNIHTPERIGYEEMTRTQREIQDGELEQTAFQRFGERTGIPCYRRFVRILLQSMQKGSHGVRMLLEQEVETAYEERRNNARRMGEEAGTKLLLPMMGMLVIVMAIVIAPAIMNFKG